MCLIQKIISALRVSRTETWLTVYRAFQVDACTCACTWLTCDVALLLLLFSLLLFSQLVVVVILAVLTC